MDYEGDVSLVNNVIFSGTSIECIMGRLPLL